MKQVMKEQIQQAHHRNKDTYLYFYEAHVFSMSPHRFHIFVFLTELDYESYICEAPTMQHEKNSYKQIK